MRATVLFALAAAAASAQEAPDGPRDWACDRADGEVTFVSLWVGSDLGPLLHCVDTPELAGRIGACAPDGGWGLSAAGSSDLLAAITDPSDATHDGNWFFARVGPSQFVASASEGSGPPLTLEVAGDTVWRMTLDLASGQGTAYTAEGSVALDCLGS